jgi:predicted nucleic acid-binding protein
VLPRIFEQVYAPTAVLREMADPSAPELVRQWSQAPPAWLKVADPLARLPATASLDPGEADAISLAKERGISDLLIDEFQGRKIAVAQGLSVLPTLAVLEKAAEHKLLELRPALEALLRTSYRIRRELVDAALARDAERNRR